MIGVAVALVLVVWLVARRAKRRRDLAGLNGTRPVFYVDPPTRRLGSRRTERL